MDKKAFSISESFNQGWNRFGDNALAYVGALACAGVMIFTTLLILAAIFFVSAGPTIAPLIRDNMPGMMVGAPLGTRFPFQEFSGNSVSVNPAEIYQAKLNILEGLKPALPYLIIPCILGFILLTLLDAWVKKGLVTMSLKTSRGEKVSFMDLFETNNFWKFYLSSLLFQLVTWGPLVLIMLVHGILTLNMFTGQLDNSATLAYQPQMAALTLLVGLMGIIALVYGIAMTMRYFFFPFFVMDKDFGPARSLKASSQMLKLASKSDSSLPGRVLFLILLIIGFGALGSMGRIWILAVAPIIMITLAFTYTKILQVAEHEDHHAFIQ